MCENRISLGCERHSLDRYDFISITLNYSELLSNAKFPLRAKPMQLIAPDILMEAKGLSLGAAFFTLLVGFLLWAFGWRWHRFWVVFGITTAAGVLGLSAGKAAGGQVLVIGVLLAFAGGVMALEIAKLLAFVAGGVGAWIAVQSVLPHAQEMWAVFLAGGLFGVILYRLWTMMIASFVGVLISWHAAFFIAQSLGTYDAVKWVGDHSTALNGGVIVATLLGIAMQVLTTEKPKADEKKSKKADKHDDHHEEPTAAPWWHKLPGLKAA